VILQVFPNNGEQLRRYGSDFARRKSGVRIPSAQLRKRRYLQIKRGHGAVWETGAS
jgi:hypothetical protein